MAGHGQLRLSEKSFVMTLSLALYCDLKPHSLLPSLGYSTMKLMRSTCGKSRHLLTSPHLDSGTYILEHAEHFWPPYPYADLMVQFTTVSEEQNKKNSIGYLC